jgi:cell division protein ZapA
MNLARELDARIAAFRNEFGELGDRRLIVMAAITVADELAEAGLRIKRLEEEIAALQNAQVATSDRNKAARAAIASTLSAAAERVESITKRLTQTIANSELLIGI